MISLDNTYEEANGRNKAWESLNQSATVDGSQAGQTTKDETAVTVFDLVHRGRQRELLNKEMSKKNLNGSRAVILPVCSPKIMSPTERSIGTIGGAKKFFPSQSNVNSGNNIGIKRNLSQSYNTHSQGRRNPKQAIRDLHNEIQSALPDINSSKS